MGCRKLTYYPDTELKTVNEKKELTLKISSQKSCSVYRFGFNGKEKDDEVKGDGDNLDFVGGIYDLRLERWLSLDPLMDKYLGFSAYNFCANNPIIYVDPDGKKIVLAESPAERKIALANLQKLTNQVLSSELVLGHELIHAQRSMKGETVDYKTESSVNYTDKD